MHSAGFSGSSRVRVRAVFAEPGEPALLAERLTMHPVTEGPDVPAIHDDGNTLLRVVGLAQRKQKVMQPTVHGGHDNAANQLALLRRKLGQSQLKRLRVG